MKRRTFVTGLFASFQAAVMAKVGVSDPMDLTPTVDPDDNPKGLPVVQISQEQGHYGDIINRNELIAIAKKLPPDDAISGETWQSRKIRVWVPKSLPLYDEEGVTYWGECELWVESESPYDDDLSLTQIDESKKIASISTDHVG